jgi:hypothetical protein
MENDREKDPQNDDGGPICFLYLRWQVAIIFVCLFPLLPKENIEQKIKIKIKFFIF